MLASAVHDPLQLASHLASHDALGAVPWHSVSQLAEQVAEQLASHLARSPDPAQLASQLPSQLAWQDVPHSNDPGSTSHSAEQSALQLPAQSTVALASHSPEHDASSFA